MRRIISALFISGIVAGCSAGMLIIGDDTEAEPRQSFGASKCDGGDINSWSYCSTKCLCSEGEGDCDSNTHCEGDLVCRRNVGKHFGLDRRMDFCLPKDWTPGDPSCKAGEVMCGDLCVNTDKDPNNCGGCGQVCPDGAICGGNGFCTACDEDMMVCGNNCVDFETDAKHCGGCGQICPIGAVCEEAVCKVKPAACGDGTCHPTESCTSCQADCGKCSCTEDADCAPGELCLNNVCEGPTECVPGAVQCGPGKVCKGGNCVDAQCAADADCDDGDACTTDACDAATGTCTSTPISGCCASDSDCDDGSPCTTNTCDGGLCRSTPISGCCASDSDCDDGNPCTDDACNAATGLCWNSPISTCCTASSDCDDGDACTKDSCNTTNGSCKNSPISGCCSTNADCDDGDSCTEDICNANNKCENTGNCCTPSCAGKSCGDPDGCGGTCSAGSGCMACPKSPCDLVQQCGCADGQACTTTYQPDGATECRAVLKNGTELDTCGSVEECAPGYLCMGLGNSWNRCKPFCNSDADCSGSRAICRAYNKGAVANTNFCTSNCDPMSDDFFVSDQSPDCPTGYQCHALRDSITGRGLSECAKKGAATILDPCSSAADCDWGMNCVMYSGGGMCMQECRLTAPKSQCLSPTTCVPYNKKVTIGGVEYGYCALP